MTSLSHMRVVVAGGGAVGSAVALAVQRAGAAVVLADPAALGDNASGVAAGMLAPAFEAALDPVSAAHFELYRSARDLWPGFAASLDHGALVHPCGALWAPAEPEGAADMLARLRRLGAQAEPVSALEAARLSPGLEAGHGGVFTEEDWRLEPAAMLAAMRAALLREGGVARLTRLTGFAPGRAELSDGAVAADAVVLASGLAPAGLADPPAEIGVLTPIKGQILRAPWTGPRSGPVVRGAGVYVVPSLDGAWIGATMQPGFDDRGVDPAATAALKAAAVNLFPTLASAQTVAMAGVRGATPDGLPLVGAGSRPGVVLALGARRNGWLLAPMIAAAVVEALSGRAVAGRLDSRRFDQARLRAG